MRKSRVILGTNVKCVISVIATSIFALQSILAQDRKLAPASLPDYLIAGAAPARQGNDGTQTQYDIRPLKLSEPTDREMKNGEGHFYSVELKQGEVLLVSVEKHGVSALLGLGRPPEIRPLGSSNFNHSYGHETLTHLVKQSGLYMVFVGARPEPALSGSYRLTAQKKTIADEAVSQRISAEGLLAEGVELIARGNKEARLSAMDKLKMSVRLWQTLRDQYWEAYALNLIGSAQIRSNKLTDAKETLSRVVPLWQTLNDKSGEAIATANLGNLYAQENKKRDAAETLARAVNLVRENGDREHEAAYLIRLAWMYGDLGEREKGIAYWFAGTIRVDNDDMAHMLAELGLVKKEYGDVRVAKEFLELTLIYALSERDEGKQARALRNLSEIYLRLGRKSEALTAAKAAINLFEEAGDGIGLAFALGYLSEIRLELHEREKALDLAKQALSLVDRQKYTKILLWAGEAYYATGQPERALYFLHEGLLLTKRSLDRTNEARALKDLMLTWRALGNSRLAIFYGKQAVNVLQDLRSFFRAADQGQSADPKITKKFLGQPADQDSAAKAGDQPEELGNPADEAGPFKAAYRINWNKNEQRLFLKSYEQIYRELAALLIEGRRLAEAQEVLITLKDQQALDFDPSDTTEIQPLSTTPREKAVATTYKEASEQLLNIKANLHRWGEESEEDTVSIKFVSKHPESLSEEEQQREDGVTIRQLDDSVKNLSKIISEIETNFKQPVGPEDRPPDVKTLGNLQETLRLLTDRTHEKSVAIFQLVGNDNFYTILVTPDDISSASFKISAAEINSKAQQLWGLLQSTDFNPAFLSSVLYDLTFKPIENRIPKDTKNILWSLDESLRYVPMSALFDGKQYLVERYDHVLLSRSSRSRLLRKAQSPWTGYGFATSQGHKVEFLDRAIEFEPLDVRDELQIFRTKGYPQGIISGNVLSDGEFNKRSLITNLRQSRPLVHISSHFYFRPGDEYRSFLLLGDGNVMNLAEMKEQANLFQGVDLLTLSACDTAAELPDANGREIDGFAELAQRLGANSVMATLWQVKDVSTALLMKEFYRNKQLGGLNKADALRRSQLNMLSGRTKAALGPGKNAGQVSTSKGSPSTKDLIVEKQYKIPYRPNESKGPYAHPHYWSPFVLFGNWQ